MSESKEGMTAVKTAVTADQIIAEVRRLAAERPDFIYEKPAMAPFCLYKHGDGSPGCIFGQALDNLGVEVDPFTYGSIDVVLNERSIERSSRQAAWMTTVQGEQDTHHTWADSVATADRDYPLV